MVDQLSRSDARVDTVSIDGSSNGTVLEKRTYPYHFQNHREDLDMRINEELPSGFDEKQVFTPQTS